MSAAGWIAARGVRVWAEGDALTLEGLASLPPGQAAEVLAFARQNKARLLEELGGPSGLPWPMPDPVPIDTCTSAGRYACLYAIADVYGLELVQDAEGGFTLTCPATAPLDAKRAALDGLHELTPYIVERLLQREEPPQLGQIRCTGCGRHFTPANPNMAYCSVACSNHARRRS